MCVLNTSVEGFPGMPTWSVFTHRKHLPKYEQLLIQSMMGEQHNVLSEYFEGYIKSVLVIGGTNLLSVHTGWHDAYDDSVEMQ